MPAAGASAAGPAPRASARGRVALITGSTRGLGLEIARRLAAEGFGVVVTGTTAAAAERVAAELVAAGHQAIGVALDVSDEASVAAAFAAADARFGRLDVLVNNAGIAPRIDGRKAPVESTPADMWRRTIDVNLTGAFLATRAAIPLMRRNGWGRIVLIGSRAGRARSNIASAYYAASKAGLQGFMRILADEVGPEGITVNCVAPTRIATPMALTYANPEAIDRAFIAETPVRRVGVPQDITGVVAFLLSDEASFIHGATIDVNGGQYMP